MSGADEFFKLARDFETAAVETGAAVRIALQAGASQIKNQWIANASETAGRHGVHYPRSITYETHLLAGSVVAEVGPDSARPQGGMGRGFEFGSRNQPPHLDGARAITAVAPSIERGLDTAVSRALP